MTSTPSSSSPSPTSFTAPPTRWGIMGTGLICGDFASAIENVKGFTINGVASATSIDSAKSFATKYKIPPTNAYDKYELLCQNPDIDIIYIGTLNHLHYENALLALNHNKNVLMEKPFTITSEQSEHVFAVAKSKGLFIMEAFWMRFMPWANKVREIILSGQLGHISMVSAEFCVNFPPTVDRIFNPKKGGGVILDIGCYTVNAVDMVMRTFKETEDKERKDISLSCNPIVSSVVGQLHSTGVDIHEVLTLQYAHVGVSPTLAVITTSGHHWGSNQLVISGTKGVIIVRDNFSFHDSLHVEFINSAVTPHVKEHFSFDLPKTAKPMHFHHSEMLVYEAIEAAKCVSNKVTECTLQSHESTVKNMKTIDIVREKLGVKFPKEIETVQKQ